MRGQRRPRRSSSQRSSSRSTCSSSHRPSRFPCVNIVVSNLKGGVGKTTTSVYLAAAAAERGHEPVVIVDADRQASSAVWLEERPIDGVEVVEAPSERMVLRAMRADEGIVIVDTPPG